MKKTELRDRLFFTVQDVAAVRGLTIGSAQVLCSRNVRRGNFVRVKNNFYVLESNWAHYRNSHFYQISNFLQVPSYVSCMTALAFHNITTQVQRDWYENITWRRSLRLENRGISFSFYKVQARYYFGFTKDNGFFMAGPEKALLDAVYLHSLGRYPLDWSSLNLDPLDRQRLSELIVPYPDSIKRQVRITCKI